jgi:hypothetical protein
MQLLGNNPLRAGDHHSEIVAIEVCRNRLPFVSQTFVSFSTDPDMAWGKSVSTQISKS